MNTRPLMLSLAIAAGERLALTLGGVLEAIIGILGWSAGSLWMLVVAAVLIALAAVSLLIPIVHAVRLTADTNRADEATDASRTAHAALVADLRALVGGDELVSQRAVNPDEYTRRTGDRVPSYLAFYQGAADLAAVIRALLDRHAPTTVETP